MAAEGQERTERATPKRREEARKKGQVVTSRELTSAVIILVAVWGFKGFGPSLVAGMKGTMIATFSALTKAPITEAAFSALMRDGMLSILMMASPIIGLIALVGSFSVVVQHGLLWSTTPIAPDWSRINPISGFQRLFSAQGLANLAKTFLKFLVVGWVAYRVLRGELPEILAMAQISPEAVFSAAGGALARLFLWSGFVVAVIGGADYGFQKWEHERKLRMSKQEIKEEQKMTEGSPQVRSRIRSLQREMARNRMIADVPTADVVITNPTHLAVALSYKPESMNAPKVVAKGAGFVAEKIREIARENSIPVMEDKPLAQTLFKTVEVGQEVPSAIYRAVAEILAYVYKLKGKRAGS